MSPRIDDKYIDAARKTPIRQVWERLGLPRVEDGHATIRSPFREDKNPSCQLGGEKNIFFDFATRETLDPIGLVRKVRGVSFREAVEFVLERSFDSPGEQAPRAPARPMRLDAIEELAQVRGWRPEALHALGAESRNAQAPREVHFPMRDAKGTVSGFRRRRSDGKPFSCGSKALSCKGSKSGLLCPWPLPEDTRQVLVVEGEADACAALSAGFPAVVATPGAQPSRTCVQDLQKLLVKREVILFPDPDEAGRKWLERIGKALANVRCLVRFVPAQTEDLDKRLRGEENPRETLDELVRDAILFSEPAPEDGKSKPMICGSGSGLPPLILPNEAHGERFSDTARMLFPAIARKHVLFQRGGRVVEIVETQGETGLSILSPDAFRTRIEKHFDVRVYRAGPHNTLDLRSTVCPRDTAKALLETTEAREHLPAIAGLSGCPLIDEEGRVLGQGYDPKTGWFITSGQTPPEVPLSEATQALGALLDDFDFVCPGDRSRALASFITPALRLGGLLHLVPCDVAEANTSQSGKTYRQKVVAALYKETPRIITQRQMGGVGSFDESLSARLSEGRPFIQMDNLRGKLDSPNLEAFMTSERAFPVRVPHKGEMMIDPSRFFIFVSSNGFETTRDFANRSAIIRIRKRPRTAPFRQYPEGDLLAHVRARQSYYLGCVFAVVRAWLDAGKPRTQESRHDFRDWACSLDWIVQNLFETAPLLDGHDAARERVSDPNKGFIRSIAAQVEELGKLGQELTASEIYEFAEENDIAIPGLKQWNCDSGKRRIGTIFSRTFDGASSMDIEDYRILLGSKNIWRPQYSDYQPLKCYTFDRVGTGALTNPQPVSTEDVNLMPF